MTDSSKPTVEQTLSTKVSEVRELAQERLRDGEEYVRTEPLQAIAYAVAAGYVLRILPVGAIVRGVVRLGVSALKPAALLYGAAKVYELLQSSNEVVQVSGPKSKAVPKSAS